MEAHEIFSLRKAGKLDEALTKAEALLLLTPDDIWARRAAAWVYVGLIGRDGRQNPFGQLSIWLPRLAELALPGTEKVLYRNVAWESARLINQAPDLPSGQLTALWRLLQPLPLPRPDTSWSFLLRAFHKHAGNWSEFAGFTTWWGLEDHLLPADYRKYITPEGRKIMSLAEMVYIALAKKALEQPAHPHQLEKLLPTLQQLYRQHPGMDYMLYYAAKILLALNRKEEFRQYFLPFLRKKQRDFWVWDLYSEAWPPDSEEYFSCLCKALMCEAPHKFTIHVKEKIAAALLQRGLQAAARREYQDILAVRQQEGWPLHDKHRAWQQQPWWEATAPAAGNGKLYRQQALLAESLLYAHLPENLLVVNQVNPAAGVFGFVMPGPVAGFAHYKKLPLTPREGEAYLARLQPPGQQAKSSFYRVHTLRPRPEGPPAGLVRQVEGRLSIRPGRHFGFLEQKVFVPPALVGKYKWQDGDRLTLRAVLSYNPKKKNWGWKAIAPVPEKPAE